MEFQIGDRVVHMVDRRKSCDRRVHGEVLTATFGLNSMWWYEVQWDQSDSGDDQLLGRHPESNLSRCSC